MRMNGHNKVIGYDYRTLNEQVSEINGRFMTDS